jgi:hypothetical protein
VPPRCEDCRFAAIEDAKLGTGDCRRHPPWPGRGYPCVSRDQWCGEFRPRDSPAVVPITPRPIGLNFVDLRGRKV